MVKLLIHRKNAAWIRQKAISTTAYLENKYYYFAGTRVKFDRIRAPRVYLSFFFLARLMRFYEPSDSYEFGLKNAFRGP